MKPHEAFAVALKRARERALRLPFAGLARHNLGMADSFHLAPSRALRADVILMSAIGVVAALLLLLMVVLSIGARLHGQVFDVVANARAARAEVTEFTLAYTDMHATAITYFAVGDPTLLERERDQAQLAQLHLNELARLTAHDPDLTALTAQVVSITAVQQDMLRNLIARRERGERLAAEALDEGRRMQAALREPLSALQRGLNQRIDRTRAAEAVQRGRTYMIAMLLAVLSMIASGLAIYSLRRERDAWRLAHEALEASRAAAAQSDLAKSRFLATASHDMRQPLHALALYASAMRRRVENPEALDILTKMDSAIQSMIGMFASLLDLARIQADVVRPEPIVFNLRESLERVLAEFAGADIVMPAQSDFIIRTDPVLLERALRNLIANGLKHGGGKVWIDLAEQDGLAAITVRDQGPGVSHEDQTRIFEEFVRLNTRAGAEGLGLGLAIVQRISTLLGLDLTLKSAPGEGAAFTLHAPLAAVRALAPDISRGNAIDLGGVRVLVMDDEKLALEAVSHTLRDAGAEVRACANEADVQAQIDAGFKPHVLVMDLRIDGSLVGVQIADRARARLSPKPNAIMVTGDTAPETLAALRASGHSWLIKPVDARGLMAAVRAKAAA